MISWYKRWWGWSSANCYCCMLALFVSSALLSLTVEPCVLRTGIRTIWRTECDKKMAALDILHRPLLRSDCWVAKTDLIGLVHITDRRLMQCVSLCLCLCLCLFVFCASDILKPGNLTFRNTFLLLKPQSQSYLLHKASCIAYEIYVMYRLFFCDNLSL